jgi:hypothetical protein
MHRNLYQVAFKQQPKQKLSAIRSKLMADRYLVLGINKIFGKLSK